MQAEVKDSITFIQNLYTNFILFPPSSNIPGSITAYDTIKINGSDAQYLFIEYTYKDGPMIDYPWKNQFLITENHKPVKSFQAKRYEWIEIFPGEPPCLLLLNVTGKGNGYHEIYKLVDEIAVNIYEGGNSPNILRTYDEHQDNDIFIPAELQLIIQDYNGDGINDLIFKGTRFTIDLGDEYTKEEDIEYIFLYNPISGYFNRYFISENCNKIN